MNYPSICFDRYYMPGFDIAATDLCLSQDYKLFDGTIFRKGAKYFTFPEIKALLWRLELLGQISDECDIPTDEECEQIIAQYGWKDGVCRSNNLASELGLGYYGYIGIISSIDAYSRAPRDFHYSQALGYGVNGSYWCRGTGEHEGEAMILHLNSKGRPMICKDVIGNGANIGCSVRLIRRRR